MLELQIYLTTILQSKKMEESYNKKEKTFVQSKDVKLYFTVKIQPILQEAGSRCGQFNVLLDKKNKKLYKERRDSKNVEE